MPVDLDCQVCGAKFSVPPSRRDTAKTCSKACSVVYRAEAISNKVTLTCPQCSKPYQVPECHVSRRRFCSNECREKSTVYQTEKGLRHRGSGNPLWKGGRIDRQDGYIYRLVGTEHPFGSKQGYMLEHRKVMEDWLRENDPTSHYLIQLGGKLYLSPEYDIHHEDEDRKNNEIRNLRCMLPAEHRKLHAHKRRLAKA